MHDDDPVEIPKDNSENSGVSRREFLKISSLSVAVPLVAGPKTVMAAGQEVPVHGPGKVPMEFSINGKNYKAELEPRVTLLDVLRDEFDLTGAKRVCDRAECGACTVLMDSKPVYACSVLAIEAQLKAITTVESLAGQGKLLPVQQAFVDSGHGNDLISGPVNVCARSLHDVYGFDAGHLFCRAGIDTHELGVRIGATQDFAVQHAGTMDIVGVLGRSGNFGGRIHASGAFAD